jgi:hypothetical protein
LIFPASIPLYREAQCSLRDALFIESAAFPPFQPNTLHFKYAVLFKKVYIHFTEATCPLRNIVCLRNVKYLLKKVKHFRQMQLLFGRKG